MRDSLNATNRNLKNLSCIWRKDDAPQRRKKDEMEGDNIVLRFASWIQIIIWIMMLVSTLVSKDHLFSFIYEIFSFHNYLLITHWHVVKCFFLWWLLSFCEWCDTKEKEEFFSLECLVFPQVSLRNVRVSWKRNYG